MIFHVSCASFWTKMAYANAKLVRSMPIWPMCTLNWPICTPIWVHVYVNLAQVYVNLAPSRLKLVRC